MVRYSQVTQTRLKEHPVKISIFGSLSGFTSPVDDTVAYLAQLREEGFRRVWFAQMPYEPDLLTVLAVGLREVDGIEAGTGVLPIQNQHPMLLAQRALTISQMSGGRLLLGLGMTHQAVTEGMWGIPWDKPVRRLGEYLDGLLPLLNGEKADASGETVTTRGALRLDIHNATSGSFREFALLEHSDDREFDRSIMDYLSLRRYSTARKRLPRRALPTIRDCPAETRGTCG